jgi:pyruvate/2-oxoglutarate dehydrogenase complex dihydrolipoamide acyltransferase (E2) component
MKILKFMDNHDLLPENITRNSIYHSSIIVSNLGSFKSSSIYHNLTDFGTASSLITMGAIHKEPVINDKGEVEVKDVCDFGINLDERIGDGYYFVKSMKMFEYIITHPEVLEEPLGDELTIKE